METAIDAFAMNSVAMQLFRVLLLLLQNGRNSDVCSLFSFFHSIEMIDIL